METTWFHQLAFRFFRKHISRRKSSPSQMRIIHPSHLKYEESRKMPYFAMTDRLRTLFKNQCVLVTCGYSFQDQHINQTLMVGIKSNPNSNIFALLHGNLRSYPHAIKLSSTHPSLSLLALDEAVIGTNRASWIERKEKDTRAIPIPSNGLAKRAKKAIRICERNSN
jgi:hypothetical protein